MWLILANELATLLGDFAMTIFLTRRCFFRSSLVLMCAVALHAIASAQASRESKFVGPGSCSASACHGGVAPAKNSRILQNEFSTWVLQDKHNQAYRALQTPVARRMGKLLNIGDPTASPKCLTCHALYVPKEQQAREFDISEGVSCESCHGPASVWLGPHSLKGATRKQSLAMGMYDTADLLSRSEKCTTCHVGTSEKSVDHEMIAAGHPDLIFQLDAFTAVMPPHWKPEADAYAGVKAWSVGQAVELRDTLKRLQRRAGSSQWPEYSELECFSCHHSLVRADNSWRQGAGYRDRVAGTPPMNPAHSVLFRYLVREVDPESAKQLDAQLLEVFQLTSKLDADRGSLAKSAASAATSADAFARKLNEMTLDRKTTQQLQRSIIENATAIANEGPRTAEQAAMALESFTVANEKAGPKQPETRSAIRALFKLLENPSNYNAPQFAAQLRKVGATLR
jgi:hypothetical protein